jgi:LemA protein
MWWIILVIIAIPFLAIILIYNKLIRGRTRCEEAWSDIQVQLKRRHDLVPNLVNTVKGYAKHEKQLLENVTKARNQAIQAKDMQETTQKENALSSTLKTLFAVAENYPDLKANANFLELQRELTDTENKIQAARRFYNGNIRDFNIAIQSFPTNIIAGNFNFEKKDLFELATKKEAEVPNVSFEDKKSNKEA